MLNSLSIVIYLICIWKCTSNISSTWNFGELWTSTRAQDHSFSIKFPINDPCHQTSLTVLPVLLECLCVCSNIPEVKGPRVQVWRGRKCFCFLNYNGFFCLFVFLLRLIQSLPPRLLFQGPALLHCVRKSLWACDKELLCQSSSTCCVSLLYILFPGKHFSYSQQKLVILIVLLCLW